MKSIKLFAAFAVLFPACAFAQPQITSANVNPNFSGEFYWTLADGFNPGNAGPNQTWNFSSLNLTLLGTDTSIPVAGSPYAAQFPTATYLYKFEGMGGTRYYYHNVTAQKYDILSLGYAGNVGSNYTPDPMTWVKFPYTYGSVFTDTFRSTDDEVATTATYTYDGYGTLVLPTGTYTNVVRQKVVKNGQTDYNWFNVQPFYPLLQTALEENSIGVVKNTSLGLDDATKPAFALWPNPTSGALNISCDSATGQAVTISVYDTFGRKVAQQQIDFASNPESTISLENHIPGFYMVAISDARGNNLLCAKIAKQ